MVTVLIGVVWAAMLVPYLKGIFNHLPLLADYSELMVVLSFVLPVVFALPALLNKFCLVDYLFYFLLVTYYFSNYIFFPENAEYLTENAVLCLLCVYPFYFIGRIIDIDKQFNLFVFLSTICIVMDLFYFLFYAPSQKNMDEVAGYDNMYASYVILPHVALLLWSTLARFRLWKAVLFVLGVLFMLSCGTRGPLVCLGFFGAIYFFFYMNFKGAIYVKGTIIATLLLILANLRSIALLLAEQFSEMQLSTRILEKVILGDLGNDTYRSVLRDKIYEVLDSDGHFFGLGLFGCQNYDVAYPHYLPLDLAGTYGYVIGYALLIVLFVLIGWAVWIARRTKSQIFILFLFSLGIIKLLLSGTFVNEVFFYMLIGFCAKTILSRNSTCKVPTEIQQSSNNLTIW